jgi:hypothetical protein
VRFNVRLRMNRKEMERLEQAAQTNRNIARDESMPEEQRVEAEQRLAEIMLRFQILKEENQKL